MEGGAPAYGAPAYGAPAYGAPAYEGGAPPSPTGEPGQEVRITPTHNDFSQVYMSPFGDSFC
jgi:hypothetical protein